MNRYLLLSSISAVLFLFGCAEGGGGSDAAAPDADAPVDTGVAMMMMDAGTGACPTGQHRCGGGCIDDLANEPGNGCRNGCGEACPAPANAMATCTAAGECDWECTSPFTREGDACVCTPRTCEDMGYQCGAPDNGCGMALDCGSCGSGGVCTDGMCMCTPDEIEPNENRSAVDSGAATAAIPNSSWSLNIDTNNLHDAMDQDWYRFSVSDTGIFDSNPTVSITLDPLTDGSSNFDLAAYYVCDEGGDISSCTVGSADNTIGRGCRSSNETGTDAVTLSVDCDNLLSSDDHGTLYIHVINTTFGGSCEPYQLRIRVDS